MYACKYVIRRAQCGFPKCSRRRRAGDNLWSCVLRPFSIQFANTFYFSHASIKFHGEQFEK